MTSARDKRSWTIRGLIMSLCAALLFCAPVSALPTLALARDTDNAEIERAVILLRKGEDTLDYKALEQAERIFLKECQGPERDNSCEYYLARLYLAMFGYYSQIKGDMARANKNLEMALDAGNDAVKRRPNDPDVHVLLGKINHQIFMRDPISGLTKAALSDSPVVAEYERALELDPQNGEAEMGLGIYYMYLPRFLGGDHHRARNHFKAAVKLMPSNPEPLVWIAISYRMQGSLEKARIYLGRALVISPESIFVQTEDKRLREAEKQADGSP